MSLESVSSTLRTKGAGGGGGAEGRGQRAAVRGGYLCGLFTGYRVSTPNQSFPKSPASFWPEVTQTARVSRRNWQGSFLPSPNSGKSPAGTSTTWKHRLCKPPPEPGRPGPATLQATPPLPTNEERGPRRGFRSLGGAGSAPRAVQTLPGHLSRRRRVAESGFCVRAAGHWLPIGSRLPGSSRSLSSPHAPVS